VRAGARAGVALAVLALAVAPALPVARAATSPWSLDETVGIAGDGAHATRAWHIAYDPHVYSNVWTLAIPPGATFVGAHDGTGALTAAPPSHGQVTITTRGSPFDVDLTEPLTTNGAFLQADAGPSAAKDSPTSVRFDLPSGWTLSGWAASSGVAAPKNGTWRGTGPFFVEALLVPRGTVDPGPDARGVAGGVAREANANVSARLAQVDVTIVYDTDQYSPTWLIPLPDDAKLVSVTAPL